MKLSQAWLREPEWCAIDAVLGPSRIGSASTGSNPAAGSVALAPGSAAVAYCVARAYLLPTDLRYVRPLAARLLGSDAPKTLWLLEYVIQVSCLERYDALCGCPSCGAVATTSSTQQTTWLLSYARLLWLPLPSGS